jgi:hypothetical protein
MNQNQTEIPPLPFHRCPICRAVDWPGWETTHRHRPPCPNQDVKADKWKATP